MFNYPIVFCDAGSPLRAWIFKDTESAVYMAFSLHVHLYDSLLLLSFLNCENCLADDWACDVCWPVSEACIEGNMGRNLTQCVPWKESVSIQRFSFGCVSVPVTAQPWCVTLNLHLCSHFYTNQRFRLSVFGQELEKGGNASESSERTNTGKKVKSGSAHSISKNRYSLNFSGRLQKVKNQFR